MRFRRLRWECKGVTIFLIKQTFWLCFSKIPLKAFTGKRIDVFSMGEIREMRGESKGNCGSKGEDGKNESVKDGDISLNGISTDLDVGHNFRYSCSVSQIE